MRHLSGPGEWDYDYNNDILFFKIKNREYSRSVEFNNFVIDFDKENYITGIQIFSASTFFKLPKISIKQIKAWKFSTLVENNNIKVDFMFNAFVRNKLIEKNPIIFEKADEELPNSSMVCRI